jgi:hypothetical protein
MDWKEHGVTIVHAGELDMNTADVRDDAGGGDHACANGSRETVGRAQWWYNRMRRRDRIITVN